MPARLPFGLATSLVGSFFRDASELECSRFGRNDSGGLTHEISTAQNDKDQVQSRFSTTMEGLDELHGDHTFMYKRKHYKNSVYLYK